MKCEICSSKIEEIFLSKIKGTYFVKGKKKIPVCSACQKKYSTAEIKQKLKLE